MPSVPAPSIASVLLEGGLFSSSKSAIQSPLLKSSAPALRVTRSEQQPPSIRITLPDEKTSKPILRITVPEEEAALAPSPGSLRFRRRQRTGCRPPSPLRLSSARSNRCQPSPTRPRRSVCFAESPRRTPRSATRSVFPKTPLPMSFGPLVTSTQNVRFANDVADAPHKSYPRTPVVRKNSLSQQEVQQMPPKAASEHVTFVSLNDGEDHKAYPRTPIPTLPLSPLPPTPFLSSPVAIVYPRTPVPGMPPSPYALAAFGLTAVHRVRFDESLGGDLDGTLTMKEGPMYPRTPLPGTSFALSPAPATINFEHGPLSHTPSAVRDVFGPIAHVWGLTYWVLMYLTGWNPLIRS